MCGNEGNTRCAGSDVQRCGPDGIWDTPTSCGANQICSGGSCVDRCTSDEQCGFQECTCNLGGQGWSCSGTIRFPNSCLDGACISMGIDCGSACQQMCAN
jgi:hypothetical protein